MVRYFNLSVLVIFLLLVLFGALQAWNYMSYPNVIGSFYNPALGMYEPVYEPRPLTPWMYPIFCIDYLVFRSPLWFKLSYFSVGAYVLVVYVLPYSLARRAIV